MAYNNQDPIIDDHVQDDDVPQPAALQVHVVTASQISSLQEYNGETDIDLWFEAVEGAQDQYGWSNAEACHAAKRRLRGEAAAFITSQKKINKIYAAWLAVPAAQGQVAQLGLKDELRKRFKITTTNVAAAAAVLNLRQKDSESISAFSDRVIECLDVKNFMYDAAAKQTDEYQRFMQAELFTFLGAGMKEHLRAKTLGSAQPPRDAEALLTAAKFVEAETTRSKTSGTSHVTSVTGGNDHEDSSEIASLSLAVNELKLAVQGQRKEALRNVTCYNCQGRGHLSQECPSEKKNQGQPGRSVDSRRQGQGPPRRNWRPRGYSSYNPRGGYAKAPQGYGPQGYGRGRGAPRGYGGGRGRGKPQNYFNPNTYALEYEQGYWPASEN